MTPRKVTRATMADTMQQEFNSYITESRPQTWRRANTVILEQGDVAVSGELVDFHLLEVILGGHHRGRSYSPQEKGDGWSDVRSELGSISLATKGEHTAEATGTATIHQIYIDDAVFRDVACAMTDGDPDKAEPLSFFGVYDPALSSLTRSLLEEARRPRMGGDLNADMLVQQIAVSVLRRRYGNDKLVKAAPKLSPDEFSLITDFLESRIDTHVGIDMLGELLDRDTISLAKAFKATTGLPLPVFLGQIRLRRVCDLLIHTEAAIAEITEITGFASPEILIRAFRAHFGLPPDDYRREVRN